MRVAEAVRARFTRRAIDFQEGEKLDETALKILVRAAVALNQSKAKPRPKPKSRGAR